MFCLRLPQADREEFDSTMVSVIDSAEKGWGLYSYAEVARYLGVHQKTLRSWFSVRRGKPPLLRGDVSKSVEEGAWLNFHDFIQAFAVKKLVDGGANPRHVREAISEARDRHGLPYPLSMRGYTIYVGKDGRVHILPPGQTDPEQLTGKRKRQISFMEIIKGYIDRIEFDEESGMANRFVVHEKPFPGGVLKRVIMQPNINFGEPTVEGTGYRAATLRNAVDAEGSEDAVARIYEVDKNDVIVAVDAFKHAPELQAAA